MTSKPSSSSTAARRWACSSWNPAAWSRPAASTHIEKIDDIIDLLALYRPGAMQFIDQMIEVKKGRKKRDVRASAVGAGLRQHLRRHDLSGAGAERRQGARRLHARRCRPSAPRDGQEGPEEDGRSSAAKFVDGAEKTNDIGEKLADQIFDKIEMFAGYGFNKSHSACYGHISYWTAYLKANHPVEFMAALLSNEIHNTDKIGVFVSECHRMGIEILPPDLNASQLRFSPEVTPNGAQRHPLRPRRHQELRRGRDGHRHRRPRDKTASSPRSTISPRASIPRSSTSASSKTWSKPARSTGPAKPAPACSPGSNRSSPPPRPPRRDRASGQVSMFDSMDFAAPPPRRNPSAPSPPCEEWSKDDRLAHEKELLGFYVTGHPLDKFRSVIDSEQIPPPRPASTISIYPTRASVSPSPAWSARSTPRPPRPASPSACSCSRISPAARKSCCGAKPSSPPATPACWNPGRSSSSRAPSRWTTAPAAAASPATNSANSNPNASPPTAKARWNSCSGPPATASAT